MLFRLSFIVFALACSLAVLPAQAADTVRIYRFDGSKQCEEGTGRSLAADARVLRRLGIVIRAMRKAEVPGRAAIMMCGALSIRANTYVIGANDWRRHGKRLKGFARWPR